VDSFTAALEALRSRRPAPRHPPHGKPAPVASMIARWRELRAANVPPGSDNREVAELRAKLLADGHWREVYR